jgi:hypothetical protein
MNGYTQDVIDSLKGMEDPERSKMREIAKEMGDEAASAIYRSISVIFIESMDVPQIPALAKEFVARAMMHEVDWKAVAAFAASAD